MYIDSSITDETLKSYMESSVSELNSHYRFSAWIESSPLAKGNILHIYFLYHTAHDLLSRCRALKARG